MFYMKEIGTYSSRSRFMILIKAEKNLMTFRGRGIEINGKWVISCIVIRRDHRNLKQRERNRESMKLDIIKVTIILSTALESSLVYYASPYFNCLGT